MKKETIEERGKIYQNKINWKKNKGNVHKRTRGK